MDQKEALAILVEHSFLLPQAVKKKITANLETMTEEQVAQLGQFLALEKKKSIEKAEETSRKLSELAEMIDNFPENPSV